MRIYIPSLGRADERVRAGPAAQMEPGEQSRCVYVVPPEEVSVYETRLRQYGIGATVVGCPERGIARTRLWIGQDARSRGHDRFVMMDDDIGFLVRRSSETWQLRAASPEEVGQMIVWMENALSGHAHVSISAREGNNRAGVGSVESLLHENTRTLRLLAYRTEDFLRAEHGRVEVMEDFDVNLQILRSGGSNLVSFWWAQGQRMTNEPGGCSTYRSHEVHERSALRLVELHPGLVRTRQKTNKTDREGFGTRTEVTIYWLRARAEGLRRG